MYPERPEQAARPELGRERARDAIVIGVDEPHGSVQLPDLCRQVALDAPVRHRDRLVAEVKVGAGASGECGAPILLLHQGA